MNHSDPYNSSIFLVVHGSFEKLIEKLAINF